MARGAVHRTASGAEVALWVVEDDPANSGDGHDQVFSSSRPAGGAWSAPVQVSDYVQYFSAFPNFTWSVNDAGAAAVVWSQYDPGNAHWTLRTRTSSSGGAWGAPVTVARPTPGQVGTFSSNWGKSVAIAPDGHATLLFVAGEATESASDNFGPDDEVFRTTNAGGSWSSPAEISIEPAPPTPPVCAEPDPADCPDTEGDSDQPSVVFDGNGTEWRAWRHVEGPDEAAEGAGVILQGPGGQMLLANSSESLARSFGLSGMSGDPDGAGVALAWSRETAGVSGQETWAFVGDGVNDRKVRVTTAEQNGVIRSITTRAGNAVAVAAIPPSGIDGSRTLVSSRFTAGAPAWSAPATMLESDGDQPVYGTGGRAVLTPDGLPVVAYARASSDGGAALAPDADRWSERGFTGAWDVAGAATLVQGFAATSNALVASWLATDGGVERLFTASTDGFPGAPPPPPPVPRPTMTAPGTLTATSHPVVLKATHIVRWGALDVTGYDLRQRVARWNRNFGAFSSPAAWQGLGTTARTVGVAKGNTYCYSVRSRLDSGRTSTWSIERCTIAPLDQTSMTRSAGWTKNTSKAYYGGSAFSTKQKGRTLTRTGARLVRVGLVATTCRGCGVVDVFVGSVKVGRISLARNAPTKNKQVLRLKRFSVRTGAVRVKVVSSGKLVRIDGLVVGRT